MLRIDFDAIAVQVDLRRLIEADRGQTMKGRRWACPFHMGAENPNFAITPDGRRWSCGLSGDAVDYIARRDRITLAEAASILDAFSTPPTGPARSGPKPTPPAKDRIRARTDPAWQAAADAIVRRAEAAQWERSGRAALEWLFARGLAEPTIRRLRLGFLPRGAKSDPLEVLADEGVPQPIRAPRGITIPWCHHESWYSPIGDAPGPRWVGVNVRRLAADVSAPWEGTGDKCRCFRGSTRGLPYPFGEVAPGVPALLCEGEFDPLIGWQEAGWVVNAMTVGGAQQTPSREALAALDCYPTWLLAFDGDAAGNEAARAWWKRNPDEAKRVILPHGKDLNDFHRAGGDVLWWLADEFGRLGWRWPLGGPGAMSTTDARVVSAVKVGHEGWRLTLDAWTPPSVNRLWKGSHWSVGHRLKRSAAAVLAVAALQARPPVPRATGRRRVGVAVTVSGRGGVLDPPTTRSRSSWTR